MERVKIGWAIRDVSTDKPVSIPGQMYVRVSEGVFDPVYVTALAVDGGEGSKPVIFLSCDMVITSRMDRVIAAAREKDPTIPEYAVIMNATHTHSGVPTRDATPTDPDGREIYPSEEYGKFFIKQASDALVEAWQSRKPGGIAYGYGYAVVAHSRRVVYSRVMGDPKKSLTTPPGKAIMYGKTNRPEFSHYEAGADHFLNALFTVDEEGKMTGVIVNVPCPSQVSELFTKISADYWANVREGVKKAFGENVFVLPQCAAAGDMTPRLLHYREAQARRIRLKYGLPYDVDNSMRNGQEGYLNRVLGMRYDIAEQIVSGLEDIWSWAQKEILTEVPVDHELKTLDLLKRRITPQEVEECKERLAILDDVLVNGTPEQKEYYRKKGAATRRRNETAIKLFETQDAEPTLPMRMHVARIGDVAFATCRFELYIDYMHRIQARSPFLQTFFIQLAGENGCNYLATKRGMEDGGYSASLFCNKVGYEGGQQIVEEALLSMNEMKAKDER